MDNWTDKKQDTWTSALLWTETSNTQKSYVKLQHASKDEAQYPETKEQYMLTLNIKNLRYQNKKTNKQASKNPNDNLWTFTWTVWKYKNDWITANFYNYQSLLVAIYRVSAPHSRTGRISYRQWTLYHRARLLHRITLILNKSSLYETAEQEENKKVV